MVVACLFTCAIFMLIITFSVSNGMPQPDMYKTCSSIPKLSCGKISDIGYPFWGIGERPQSCGHPALHLECPRNTTSDYPILTIGPGEDVMFRVLGINESYSNSTIELQAISNSACPLHLFTRAMPDIFGGISSTWFYYNCKLPPSQHKIPHSSECFDEENHIKAYCMRDKSEAYLAHDCEPIEVFVPWKVFGILEHDKSLSVSDSLKKSFAVNYNYVFNCSMCEASGGACGSFDDFEFMCHCKNGSFPDVCNQANHHNQTYTRKPGKWRLIVGLVVPGFFILVVALNISLCHYMKLKIHKPMLLKRMISYDPQTSDLETGNSFQGIPVFSYSELQEATNNFDSNRELGDGGFGIVYHGKLRDGREVAVKRLYEKNYKRVGQFMNEVEILTQLRHPNLVTLYGCTSRHSRELLLVYEYIPNGTVADHLYGELSGSKSLTWEIRMKIATETATALSYLHTSDIIHRDVKTNNILLDNNFSVKVADFGLSRLFPFDVTHVSTAPQGTPGYLDPEYHKCYQVTNKSDVYSFGVVLVELISSLPAVDISRQDGEINLSDYAMKRIQKGALDELVDQNLGYNSDFKVKRMITLVAELAFQCLQQEKEVRPCMTEVHETLKRIENLDYEALEAEEIDETTPKTKPIVGADTDIVQPPPSPSSVIDNWAMKSTTSNPSS